MVNIGYTFIHICVHKYVQSDSAIESQKLYHINIQNGIQLILLKVSLFRQI